MDRPMRSYKTKECAFQERIGIFSLTLSTQILIISIEIYALKALVVITPAYTDKAEVGFTMFLFNTTESRQSRKDKCACYSVPVP